MSVSNPNWAQFCDWLKTEAGPMIWSQGVKIARDHAIELDQQDGQEWKLRIVLSHRPIHPRVKLWPKDEDGHCNCASKRDPCEHIIAAAIAMKSGDAKVLDEDPGDAVRMEYALRTEKGQVFFERMIHANGEVNHLRQSLVQYVSGVRAGRTDALLIPSTRDDFAIEVALGKHRFGKLPREIMNAVVPLLSSVSWVTLDGERVSAHAKPLHPLLTVETKKVKGPLPEIVLSLSLPETAGLEDLKPCAPGLYRAGSKIVVVQIHPGLTGQAFPKTIEASKALPFLTENLNNLKKAMELSFTGEVKLPPVKDIPLVPEIEIESLGPQIISATARIRYGDVVELGASGNLELRTRKPKELPIRRKAIEKQLDVQLKHALQLATNQPTRYEGQEILEFRSKLEAFKTAGGGVKELETRGELGFVGGLDQSFKFEPNFAIGRSKKAADSLKASEVLRFYREGHTSVGLPEGGFARLPMKWLNEYADILDQLIKAKDQFGNLPKALAYDVRNMDPDNEWPDALPRWQEGVERVEIEDDFTINDEIKAELRDYQKDGARWLDTLTKAGLGALLADDMGLGKTLQVICVLQPGALIVCPKSLLANWEQEIVKFRPSLKTARYHGTGRKIDGWEDRITLTTYGTLRQDHGSLKDHNFSSIVLDESQAIKNPRSQTAKATFQMQAVNRIAMSGTPVENRLTDLWSQMNFLNPGLLGLRPSEFEEILMLPKGLQVIQQKMKPFILRRTKSEVLKDLPSRTNSILSFDLDEEERKLYDSIASSAREEAQEAFKKNKGVFTIFEALLRARQACCHPSLVPGFNTESSSKLDLLLAKLDEALENNHRCLVFSQWTSFLDLVGDGMDKRGLKWMRLDGKTRNRGGVVDRFQTGKEESVLLMSIKAGGVGLNLTSADYVFILDPWWNPTVESQATDRAHRIGQENPVMVYRLIARNTIEEKILDLQEHKKLTAEGALAEGLTEMRLKKEDFEKLLET